jgi:NADPH:quinone reductase-like Zn-dependent oxidoreductase
MRAVVQRGFGGPEVFELSDLPVPEPGPGQVLVRVHACGVCYHELIVRQGLIKHDVALPLIPGHELAGEVVERGPGVSALDVGDRVTALNRETCGNCADCRLGFETQCRHHRFIGHGGEAGGGYAEYAAVQERALVRVPRDMPFDAAAVIPCVLGTLLNGLRDVARVRPGETVLVTGAGGGLGLHAIQCARLAGARVIAVTTSPGKAPVLKEAGADDVVVADRSGFARQVKELTGGEGVDVVADNVGAPLFDEAFRSLTRRGRYVVIGQVTGDPVRLQLGVVLFKAVRVMGALSATHAQVTDAVDLVHRGRLRVFLGGVYPLPEFARVHAMLEQRQSVGRLVLVPSG